MRIVREIEPIPTVAEARSALDGLGREHLLSVRVVGIDGPGDGDPVEIGGAERIELSYDPDAEDALGLGDETLTVSVHLGDLAMSRALERLPRWVLEHVLETGRAPEAWRFYEDCEAD